MCACVLVHVHACLSTCVHLCVPAGCASFVCRYLKPPHVDVADFIQEIPTPSGMDFLAPGNSRHLSTDELVEAYKRSRHYEDVRRVVEAEEVRGGRGWGLKGRV